MRYLNFAVVLVFVFSAATAFAYKPNYYSIADLRENVDIYETAPENCSALIPLSAVSKQRDKAYLKLLAKAKNYGSNAITKYKEYKDGISYKMEATALRCE